MTVQQREAVQNVLTNDCEERIASQIPSLVHLNVSINRLTKERGAKRNLLYIIADNPFKNSDDERKIRFSIEGKNLKNRQRETSWKSTIDWICFI